VYRPDLSAYTMGRLPDWVDRLEVAPDLIVEVLSPATRAMDLTTKRDDYERFGVRECWAIDPSDASVRCWAREGERLVERARAMSQGGLLRSVASDAIAGFVLDVAALRRFIRKGV
jgi:Uma2 family endonuclease